MSPTTGYFKQRLSVKKQVVEKVSNYQSSLSRTMMDNHIPFTFVGRSEG